MNTENKKISVAEYLDTDHLMINAVIMAEMGLKTAKENQRKFYTDFNKSIPLKKGDIIEIDGERWEVCVNPISRVTDNNKAVQLVFELNNKERDTSHQFVYLSFYHGSEYHDKLFLVKEIKSVIKTNLWTNDNVGCKSYK